MTTDKDKSQRTLAVAKAMQRKLAKSVQAHVLEPPADTGDIPCAVLMRLVNNNDGHTYLVRITEYS